MRVTLVSDELYPACTGGAGQIAYYQAIGLAKAGHAVEVVTLNHPKPAVTALRSLHRVRVHSLRFPKLPGYKRLRPWLVDNNPWLVAQLMRRLERIRPDIVHFHNVHQFFSYAALAAVARHYPALVTLHDMMSLGFRKLMPEEQLTLSRLATRRVRALNGLHTVPVSQLQADRLRAHGVRTDRVIHNGIPDLARFPHPGAVAKGVIERAGGAPLVLFAGRINKLKGFDVAVEAVRGSGAKLLVVGAPGGADDEILHLPWIDPNELATLYPLAIAVIVPSLCIDCFPTVVLEAMRAGRPVIASRFSGGCESVVDGKTGAVVDPRDPVRMRDLIRLWIEQPATAEALGQAGRRRFDEHFRLERHIECLVDFYREVAG